VRYYIYSVNISAFDLNLLVVFDALLTDRSVTRAAHRLGLSQPALSNALARLRNRVGDPLFERSRRGMTPTPRALAMAEPVRTALAGFHRALTTRADAAPADRIVGVAANEYAQCVLLPRVLRATEDSLPRIVLDVRSPTAASAPADVALSIDWAAAVAALPLTDSAVVIRDPFACIARQGNRAVGARLSLDGFVRCEHVTVRTGAPPIDQLKSRISVPDFLAALWLVSRSDLIAAVPRRLAELFAPKLALRVFKPPLNLPDAVLKVAWSRHGGHDPVVRSLRARVLEAGRHVAENSKA
jgi:DNA-binding transcriptional LysR family regulator